MVQAAAETRTHNSANEITDVATQGDFNFVVTWTDENVATNRICASAFEADGDRPASPSTSWVVRSDGSLTEDSPAISMYGTGQYIIVWEADGDTGDADDGMDVYAQRYTLAHGNRGTLTEKIKGR